MHLTRSLLALALAQLLVFVSSPGALAAPTPPPKPSAKAACLAAHEQAQTLRTQKKLHAAREKFVACAKPECPVVLQKECGDELEKTDAAAPTITLEALDDKGMSDAQVKVILDGQPLLDKLTGTAVPVEPGEHVFRFQRASDGKTLEQKVMVVEGEKNRKVVADFQTLLPQTPKPTPTGPTTGTTGDAATAPTPAEAPKTVPVLAYVAAGLAVVGFGSFAVFSITGRGSETELAETCAPRCPDDEVSNISRSYLIADISLGVGIVATAAAVILALPALTQSRPRPAASLPIPWMPKTRLAGE